MPMNHTLHPATVHYPFAFITGGAIIDLLYYAAKVQRLPYIADTLGPYGRDLATAGFYMQAVGLVTAVPALATGIQQLLAVIGRGGIYEQDKKSIRPKVSVSVLHAATMDIALGLAAWSWFGRRETAMNAPTQTHVLAGVATLLLVFYSASLGGDLTYEHGVGLNLGKKNTKAKSG